MSRSHETGLLDTLHDAVHGPIDLRDEHKLSNSPVIRRLVSAPFVARLRLIRQLSYTSHFVTSADHSRFAHALGTMHVMRQLMRTLEPTLATPVLFSSLRSIFGKWLRPRAFKDQATQYKELTQHMLLAALLQDVGELPCNIATAHFCFPHENVRSAVEKFSFKTHKLEHKELFGLALIANYLNTDGTLKKAACWQLVFSLISGMLPNGSSLPGPLLALYNLVDGEVDADRIDYVHRDAFHCLGEKISPQALIQSFVRVDETGPVMENNAAVTYFYLLRARLWSAVYFSPQNRFRLALLLTAMRAAWRVADEKERKFVCKTLFKSENSKAMDLPELLDFHDYQLTLGIRILARSESSEEMRSFKSILGERGHHALQLLGDTGLNNYEGVWLKPGIPSGIPSLPTVPNDVYFDTFSDYLSVKAFRRGTVRVEGPEFGMLDVKTPFLEDAGGSFTKWFEAEPCPVPCLPPQSILMYSPREQSDEVRSFMKTCRKMPTDVIARALEDDPFAPTEFYDTRDAGPLFTGPSIFVSFSHQDIILVRRVIFCLYQLRRRYYAIIRPTEGIGTSTQRNSEEAARCADAVLVLASAPYCTRLNEIGTPLRAEMEVVRERRAKESFLKIAVLSICPWSEIKDKLPWEFLSSESERQPYVGRPLAEASGNEIHDHVEDALKHIDSK